MSLSRLVRRTAPALLVALCALTAATAAADTRWDIARTTAPETVDELKSLQDTVNRAVTKCSPYTVGIQIGFAAGSGVIVSGDGLVLTAGHVSGDVGKDCFLILQDGKKVKAKTLGLNKKMDSGMIKITEDAPDGGEWPHAKLAKSGELKKGQWLLSLGHPNGYKKGRPPVARLGQLQSIGDKKANDIRSNYLVTNCTLVGGDSGGPLFDLEGRLVGIHSQIGPSISWNLHVPVDEFVKDWEQLVAAEKVERVKPSTRPKVALGVVFPDDEEEAPKVVDVEEGGAAATAGLKAGDLITKFNGKAVATVKEVREQLTKFKPDDEVEVVAKRGGKSMTFTVTLAKR